MNKEFVCNGRMFLWNSDSNRPDVKILKPSEVDILFSNSKLDYPGHMTGARSSQLEKLYQGVYQWVSDSAEYWIKIF